MKGILLKDLYTLGSYRNTFLMMLGLAALLAIVLPGSATMVSSFFIAYLIQPAIGLFTFDESAKWNTYAATLPLQRGKVVLARYIAALLPAAVFIPLSFLVSVIPGYLKGNDAAWSAALGSNVAVICMFLLAIAICLPIAYRFGAEKARYGMLIVYLGVFGAMMLAITLLGSRLAGLEQLTAGTIAGIAAGALAFLIGLLVASVIISSKIYEKKEY